MLVNLLYFIKEQYTWCMRSLPWD